MQSRSLADIVNVIAGMGVSFDSNIVRLYSDLGLILQSRYAEYAEVSTLKFAMPPSERGLNVWNVYSLSVHGGSPPSWRRTAAATSNVCRKSGSPAYLSLNHVVKDRGNVLFRPKEESVKRNDVGGTIAMVKTVEKNMQADNRMCPFLNAFAQLYIDGYTL